MVPPAIVVTEFYTQGALRADGHNLAVYDNGNRLVPWHVLQVGPGDFCRLAFQTERGQKTYRIGYGGPPAAEKSPPWTSSAGLLVETRRWKHCDLHNLQSVRRSLATSELIGSDFVPNVFHRLNPVWPEPEPFLSLYRGTLQIDTAGKYLFFTSSQDCSFLLIDGKEVAAAPGTHGPTGHARFRGEVTLAAGPHAFEYVHAAAGSEACMVAAWQPPKAGKPDVIPPKAFGSGAVALLPATGLRQRTTGSLPDHTVAILGEVAVEDSDSPLTRVLFKDVSPQSLTGSARVHWDFGDGQSSDKTSLHIYLHPGLYTVKMSVRSGAGALETVNRVQIHRAVVFADQGKPDTLSHYLPVLDKYDPAKLDPAAIVQLVRVYNQADLPVQAAKAGQAWLLADQASHDENAAHAVAKMIGPLLRDRLDDPAAALAVWQAAGRAVRSEQGKAECEVEAADICLHDLHQRSEVKGLLDAATVRLARADNSALASRLQRVWGDWYARGGDGTAARAAYVRAMTLRGRQGTTAEQEARRGAFSRSTEAFLREKELDRAREELRHWQDQFPADKVEGYLPLLQARYWAARGKPQHAIAVAGDLLAVNPDSPYADQLVYVAAECEEKLGRKDRALTGYKSLVTSYPGSPLVNAAKEKLSRPPTSTEPKK